MNEALSSDTTRRSLAFFAIELALFALVFWGDKAGFVPLSKTPFLFLIAWASLRLRGQTWRTVGFNFDKRWPALLAIGAIAGVVFWAFEFFGENAALHALTGRYPDLHEFNDLVGNLTLLAVYSGLNLVLAALGEELVWRGYALSRVAELFSGSRLGWVVALIFVSTAFGLAHLYQGESGVVQASVQGVLLGLLYLACGRNLLGPITAHFVANSCDFVAIYLGLYPGMSVGH